LDVRAVELRKKQKRKFFRRGVTFAVMSGVCYGLYTGFLTLAETQGPWGAWLGGDARLSAFTVAFALSALAAGLNDLWSGIWSVIYCAAHGQLNDLWRTARTLPGRMMMLCAVVGGPFATVCYVAGLNSATAAGAPGLIVPIAALNCAIGAVLGRILYKQELAPHTIAGIVVCLAAGALIGGASFASIGPGALVGCIFALLAAFGWGFEGCVAGFGTVLIDYRIGIAIRQVTAGVLELVVAFPVFAAIGAGWSSVPVLLGAALGDPSMMVFAVSGLFAMPAYSFWYKGNSMCGTALGMACNGMYAFWGPFFIWIIMGVLNIGGMSASYPPLSVVQWAGAVIMVIGIFIIAVSPASWFGSRKDFDSAVEAGKPVNSGMGSVGVNGSLPLYYSILLHFESGAADDASGVIRALEPAYEGSRQLTEEGVGEALATAKENGLLDEVGTDLSAEGNLRLWYRMNGFGHEMVKRYIGKAREHC
jgi:uncharacterized membrane protein